MAVGNRRTEGVAYIDIDSLFCAFHWLCFNKRRLFRLQWEGEIFKGFRYYCFIVVVPIVVCWRQTMVDLRQTMCISQRGDCCSVRPRDPMNLNRAEKLFFFCCVVYKEDKGGNCWFSRHLFHWPIDLELIIRHSLADSIPRCVFISHKLCGGRDDRAGHLKESVNINKLPLLYQDKRRKRLYCRTCIGLVY